VVSSAGLNAAKIFNSSLRSNLQYSTAWSEAPSLAASCSTARREITTARQERAEGRHVVQLDSEVVQVFPQ
jgi:hypothetical protein